MKQISTYSANQPGIKDVPVEGMTLIVNQPLPKIESLDEWNAFLETEATTIVDALVQALPQGLTDRIAVKLMSRMVTSFTIPLEIK